MKFFLGGTTVLLILILASFEGGLSSCTKDKTIYDTITVVTKDTFTVTDTLIIQDTALTAEILTAHPWKIQELRGVMNDSIIYYLRGGSANKINYDNEYLLFNMDKTGSYQDANGAQRVISWDFVNDEMTKLVFVIYNTPANFPITWEHIRYKNNSLFYDEYYTDGNNGYNWHGQGIRIPQ